MRRFFRDKSGATAIEYALICALVVVVCIAAFTQLGGRSGGKWKGMSDTVVKNL